MVLLSLSICIFEGLKGIDGSGNLTHTEMYKIAFPAVGSGPGASILDDGLNVSVSWNQAKITFTVNN